MFNFFFKVDIDENCYSVDCFHEPLEKHLKITKHVTLEINTARKFSGVVPEDEDRHFEPRAGIIFMHELEHEENIFL